MLYNYEYIAIYIVIYADLIMNSVAVTIQMNESAVPFLVSHVSLSRRL